MLAKPARFLAKKAIRKREQTARFAISVQVVTLRVGFNFDADA
jgi:hypothetical protein